MTTMTKQDTFVGLAFPVVRVRYAGPTDYKPSRYIATCRGIRYTESYDHALSGSQNAYNAAVACWKKYQDSLNVDLVEADKDRVFIPGDLSEDSYAFTVVPAGFLND